MKYVSVFAVIYGAVKFSGSNESNVVFLIPSDGVYGELYEMTAELSIVSKDSSKTSSGSDGSYGYVQMASPPWFPV